MLQIAKEYDAQSTFIVLKNSINFRVETWKMRDLLFLSLQQQNKF